MNHKQDMLATIRGETPKLMPYAPRLDLWFNANQKRGTLPERFKDCQNSDQISRRMGWAIHKVILEFQGHGDDAILDRPLGVYRAPSQGFHTHLPPSVEREVKREGDLVNLTYHTPQGEVTAAFLFSEEMKSSGITIPWIKKHALKGPADFAPLTHIFANLLIEPDHQGYLDWSAPLGQDGLDAVYATTAASPMHHIMKVLADPTEFYYLHRDHPRQTAELAEAIGVYFRKVFAEASRGPAELVMIGANVDDTITYPPFYKEYILPWQQEAASILHQAGKLMVCHTDGENQGLLDYIGQSGVDLADSVCPAPMTKVPMEVYYSKWCDRIAIQGGIPSNLVLPKAASEDEFEAYLDHLFKVVAPGNRLILGVADAVPPDADFSRLERIAEKLEQAGELPWAVQGQTRVGVSQPQPADLPPEDVPPHNHDLQVVRDDVMKGNHQTIAEHVQTLLDQGVQAGEILEQGMLPAMEVLGERFKADRIFIPEVLMAARAMNRALVILEPHLAERGWKARGLVLMGTVKGDLHDIGKNIVSTMLRGVGFEVQDAGLDVSAQRFVELVDEITPDILGLSALLTTTMPQMQAVIEALTEAGLREKVKVMVGGAPVSATFAKEIGADSFALDAGDAVSQAKSLMRR